MYFLPLPTFSSDHQEKNEEKKNETKKNHFLSEVYSNPKILKKASKAAQNNYYYTTKTIPKQAK